MSTTYSPPGRWKGEQLLTVGTRLSDIPGRETSSHISVVSSVDHYLRLLEFPADVTGAPQRGSRALQARCTRDSLFYSASLPKKYFMMYRDIYVEILPLCVCSF
jgi:hypothetical protein